jgi:LysR family hydrogen peroxide-inducible transcriptional activator
LDFSITVTVHLPTIKQLQYLVALRQTGHFGRAADACFVTQSTLSAGLRELESLLGITLVERTRRVVRFTALGERIAEKAVRVLREAEELAEMARAEGKPLHGELRMGVIPTIAPFLLPAMLPRLRSEWPKLKLFLREETSQAACEALHRGQLDCVLLALPFGCGDVESAPLFEDRLFVAFPKGEAPRGAAVDVGSIDENRMLLLEDGHCLKDHALSACNRPELRAHAAMMGTSLHTLVQMVDNGLGLTFVPAMAIDAGILNGTGVDAKPLRSDHGFRRIALIWRRSSPREREFQLLAESLRKITRDLVPDFAGNEPAQPASEPELAGS